MLPSGEIPPDATCATSARVCGPMDRSAPLGRAVIEGPIDTPWNTYDLHVTDPAGHRLVFTSRRANPDPESAARWHRMFDADRKA